MGASHSISAICEAPKDGSINSSVFEPGGGSNDSPPRPKNPITPHVPPAPMPQLMRPETFEEKLYRKFKAEPLVPIGCLTTAYFLGSGIASFYNRDPKKSQTMMRLRVGSQFATLMIFIGYAGMNAFTLDFAPGMAVPSEQIPGISKNSGRKKEEGED